jgi:hypothetical protein
VSGFTTTSTSAQRDQKAGEDQPERAVAVAQAGAARGALQVGQLLAKGKVLKCKVRAGPEGGTQGSEEAQDQGSHRVMMHDG